MLHTITKQLQIRINITTEINQVDHYTWIIASRIFIGFRNNFFY